MRRQQAGFTLIELVLVIVIIGILAAFALPRFTNLTTEARVAALQGVQGSVRSAAALARATQLARSLASNASFTVDAQVIQLAGGYPDVATIDNMLLEVPPSGFTYDGAGVFSKTGTTSGCTVTYTNAGTGVFPTVVIASTGC